MRRSLTFEAALRDLTAARDEARALALRCLPAAYLDRHGLLPPRYRSADLDDDGPRAVAALVRRFHDEPVAELRGVALWALAMIGDPGLVGLVPRALSDEAPYVQESAVEAVGTLAAAMPASASPDRETVADLLVSLLGHEAPWVRGQAGLSLVRGRCPGAEAAVLEALASDEPDEEVRDAWIAALCELDPPGPDACGLLARVAADLREPLSLRRDAAVALAAARRGDGAAVLVTAMAHPFDRERAMEALAALGPTLPPDLAETAAARARKLARRPWSPPTTRVRAAYLLMRLGRSEGGALLDRFERRRSMADAVADARAALDRLAREPTPRARD